MTMPQDANPGGPRGKRIRIQTGKTQKVTGVAKVPPPKKKGGIIRAIIGKITK